MLDKLDKSHELIFISVYIWVPFLLLLLSMYHIYPFGCNDICHSFFLRWLTFMLLISTCCKKQSGNWFHGSTVASSALLSMPIGSSSLSFWTFTLLCLAETWKWSNLSIWIMIQKAFIATSLLSKPFEINEWLLLLWKNDSFFVHQITQKVDTICYITKC